MNPQSDPDYYRRIDFPVSPTWADHYEAQGAVVHKNFVKGDSRISATISPDTAQMLAKIMDNQVQALEAVHTRIDDQAKQIDKIKDYLRGQHEERKQENAQREPLIEQAVVATTTERARIPQGFNLPSEGMARLINGCAYWKSLEQKQKAHPAEVTFDEWNNYIGTFVRFGKPGEERIIQFSRLAPDYDADSTTALIQTARSRQPKAPTCKELGCRLDPAKCGVGNG